MEGAQAHSSTSTTAPTPFVTSSNPTSAGLPSAPASGRPRSPRVIGILKAYTTVWARVRSRPSCPTRTARVCAHVGRRVRRHHRAEPALRLVRRGDRPVRDPGQRPDRLLPHQARRPVQPGSRSRCASATTIDGSARRTARRPRATSHRAEPIYEYLPGWSEDIIGSPGVRRPAANRATTSTPRRAFRRARFRIGVGPGRDQTIVRRDVLAPRLKRRRKGAPRPEIPRLPRRRRPPWRPAAPFQCADFRARRTLSACASNAGPGRRAARWSDRGPARRRCTKHALRQALRGVARSRAPWRAGRRTPGLRRYPPTSRAAPRRSARRGAMSLWVIGISLVRLPSTV